jgi:hypothetical protein
LDAKSFDALNVTLVNAIKLLKTADLSTNVDSLLLELSADGLESSVKGHGKVYIEDLTISGKAKPTYSRVPFYDADDDTPEMSQDMVTTGENSGSISVIYQLLNLIQDHTILFLLTIIVAVFVFKRRQFRETDEMDDVMFHNLERKRKKKSSSNGVFGDKKNSSHSSNGHKKNKHSRNESKKSKNHSEGEFPSDYASKLVHDTVRKYSDNYKEKSKSTSMSSSRFIPYGSAVEEEWADGRQNIEIQQDLSNKKYNDAAQRSDNNDADDEDFADELDDIIRHFESSSSSSSGSSDSDGWQHA